MLSVLRQNTPRTTSAHLNPVKYEGGRSSQQFHNSSHRYMVTHVFPATTAEHGRSIFNPPPHYHGYQTEDFEVMSGVACFYINGSTTVAKKGDKVHIPMRAYHRFENVSKDGEDLVVSFRLDEQDFATEESFFRNFFGYIDDALRIGQQPSFFQLCLFLHTMRAPVILPGLGQKSTFIGRQVSWYVMLFAGIVIGEWLLGYKRTYPEYYSNSEQKKTK